MESKYDEIDDNSGQMYFISILNPKQSAHLYRLDLMVSQLH